MDIAPATNGRRVEPKISEDLIKRIQAAEKAKTRKEIKKEYDPVSIYPCLCSWIILAGSPAYPLWGCRHGDVYITKISAKSLFVLTGWPGRHQSVQRREAQVAGEEGETGEGGEGRETWEEWAQADQAHVQERA